MRIATMTALSAALVLSTPSFAKNHAQQPAERTAAVGAKAAEAEKKICRQLDSTGTRMAERVCLTKDDWKKVEELK